MRPWTASSRSRCCDDFEKASGIRVLPKYDVESTKTVGLTAAIIAEAARPRCDVFWNNEILNTLRLEAEGAARRLFVAGRGRLIPRCTARRRAHGTASRGGRGC